jgi:hypothetical protein
MDNTTGSGTQLLDGNDLFPNSDKWTQWTITINGVKRPMGESWNITDSKQLTISTPEGQSSVEVSVIHTSATSDTAPLPSPVPAVVNFIATTSFAIPSSNGSLNFAVDGSYDKANLNGDTLSFTNLTLNNYAINTGMFASNVTGRDVLPYIFQFGCPADIGVSAHDCNITITGITPLTWHTFMPTLNYTVQGTGSQTFTLPFKLSDFDWTITVDGVSKTEGDGWTRINDNQIKVTSANAAVSIHGLPIEHFPPSPRVYSLAIFLCVVIAGVVVAIAMLAYILSRKHPFLSVTPQRVSQGSQLVVYNSVTWLMLNH